VVLGALQATADGQAWQIVSPWSRRSHWVLREVDADAGPGSGGDPKWSPTATCQYANETMLTIESSEAGHPRGLEVRARRALCSWQSLELDRGILRIERATRCETSGAHPFGCNQPPDG
jgi:hypothetical protein